MASACSFATRTDKREIFGREKRRNMGNAGVKIDDFFNTHA